MKRHSCALGFLVIAACSSSADDPTASSPSADAGGVTGPTTDRSPPADAGPRKPDASTDLDAGHDSDGASPVVPPEPAAGLTLANVPLPAGFTRVISDRFGTGPGQNVTTHADVHAKYYEGQFYNRDEQGLVKLPNVVINGEQQTYVHFEDALVFAADHVTIQARGQADGSITSGEMVSIHTARSFCVESKYRVPSADKAWPALWWYGSVSGGDSSEIDIEQPNTPNQGVHDVSMHNHPYEYDSIEALSPHFTTDYMNFSDPSFDASTAPHVYTMCYDDAAATLEHWLDGVALFSASWKWNKSMGGTGHGPDATTIVNMAVGGNWPGNTADPVHFSADLDLYYLDYYELPAQN